MTLTKEQIAALFIFTDKKMVRWYDLQTELVDHLATAIERKMSENPTCSFEDALAYVYAGFGIFGFAKIVQMKEVQLRKENKRLWHYFFKLQLHWPNVVRSIFIASLIYLLQAVASSNVMLVLNLICAVSLAVFSIAKHRKHSKYAKKLLFTQQTFGYNIFGFCYYEILFALNFSFDDTTAGSWSHYFLGLILFFGIINLLVCIAMYTAVEAKAKSMYPEVYA